MPFGVLSGVPDVIAHAKFCVNRLRGFAAAAPRKVPFPILFRTTHSLHYRADCDPVDVIDDTPVAPRDRQREAKTNIEIWRGPKISKVGHVTPS